MDKYRINPNELEEDEINYELEIRNVSTSGPLESRLRTLRKLLREPEAAEYRHPVSYSLESDYTVIPPKLHDLEKQCVRGIITGAWSSWYITTNDFDDIFRCLGDNKRTGIFCWI